LRVKAGDAGVRSSDAGTAERASQSAALPA
jgi:hypothetical protein